MKFLSSMFQDDTGATSATRVIAVAIAFGVLIPHVVVAIKSGIVPLVFSNQELELFGLAMGAKLIQNQQEGQPTAAPKP